jgi:hypothetical protein
LANGLTREEDLDFNERFGTPDLKLKKVKGPGSKTPATVHPETELGVDIPALTGGDPSGATFDRLFKEDAEIVESSVVPDENQVRSNAIRAAGGIVGIQNAERFSTPVIREMNDVFRALSGQTTPSGRARPGPQEMSGWQKGLLFLSDIIAAADGRAMPSTQIDLQRYKALSLEDQQRRQQFTEGVPALEKYTKMMGRLSPDQRMAAATRMAPGFRDAFGDGFGRAAIQFAALPSAVEGFQAMYGNKEVFEDGGADQLIKYIAFMMAGGYVEEANEALINVGIGTADKPGMFTQEANFHAPAMLSAKMGGFIGEMREMGPAEARFASKLEMGESISPSELVNFQKALPIHSPNRFDGSVINALQSNPELFAADLPGMVTAEQKQTYDELLFKGQLSAPMLFIGGNRSPDPGRKETAPMASARARWLMQNGYQEANGLRGLGGKLAPSDTVIKGFFDSFQKQSQSFIKINQSYMTILAASRENTAPGHVSMIFAFMKMLDEISVVREGEQETARTARSMIDTFQTWADRAVTGKRLTDTQVEQFLAVAKGVWAEQAHTQTMREGNMRKTLTAWTIPHDLVMQDLLGENRKLLGTPTGGTESRGTPTQEDIDAAMKDMPDGATSIEVRQALIDDGFEF